MPKCKYAKIGYDISLYDYQINTSNKTIYFDLSDKVKTPNYDYLNYTDYKIVVVQNYYIHKSGFYYSFVSSCGGGLNSFTINYEVLNPGNEHLSLDLIPNKVTYLIFFIVWILVFIVSTFCMIRKCCMHKKPNLICLMILTTYFLIMFYCISKYYYWRYLSIRGKIDQIYDVIFMFIEVLIMGLYLLIINMMAYGYQITTMTVRLSPFLKNIIITGFILLTSMLMRISTIVVMMFMVVEIIALILLLNMDIFTNINRLKSILIIQLEIDQNNKEYICELSSKIKYYRVFMIYLYVYWILECIVLLIRPFFVLYHEWIFTLIHQILTFISMSFLFITLNYTIKKFEDGQINEPIDFPLPFNSKKDSKILEEIIIIRSCCEESSNRKRDKKFSFPHIQIGVECLFSPPNKQKPSKDLDLNQRAIIYKLENSEEQACKDVMNVVKSNNQKELSKTFNQIPHILQHTAIDLKNNENFKSLDHSNPLPNNEESKDLSKECCNQSKNGDYQLFKANKCFDFRNYYYQEKDEELDTEQKDLSGLQNTPFIENLNKIGKNGSAHKNEQIYLDKAVKFSSKLAKMTSKHLLNCIQEPIELFKSK